MSAEARMRKANTRAALVEAYRQLLTSGVTRADAAREVGRSRASLDRWLAAADRDGFAGLVPKTARCGRKSTVEKLREKIGAEAVDGLLAKARATALDTDSAVMAFRMAARGEHAPELLAAVADYTEGGRRRSSKHALPGSIRDALRVDPVLKLAHEGQRALKLRGMWTPRRLDILSGDIWTSDDTTPIWGWWVPWPHAKDNDLFAKASCEYRFGVKLLQGQFLPLMDVASQCVFTFALIARETSAYRASDIWGLFGRAFAIHGLPRLGFQLERGSWEANLIRGEEVLVEDGEVSFSRRVGGLRALPTCITPWHHEKLGADFAFPKTLQTWTSFLPKSKSIEAAFDRMQTLEGTIWGNLGRDQMRRPNERAKKLFEACRRGAEDPRLHFLSGTELVKRLEALLAFLNDEPMEGEVFRGVPRLLFEQGLREHALLRLPGDQEHLFRRNWHVTRITSGWARAKFTDAIGQKRTEHYTNPEVFSRIEGRAVVIYFDAENYEDSAQIHDAADGSYLCHAEWFDRAGMFLDAEPTGHELRKRYNQAVTTLYGDVVKLCPSRILPAEIAERRAQRPLTPALSPDGGEGEETRVGGAGSTEPAQHLVRPAARRSSPRPALPACGEFEDLPDVNVAGRDPAGRPVEETFETL